MTVQWSPSHHITSQRNSGGLCSNLPLKVGPSLASASKNSKDRFHHHSGCISGPALPSQHKVLLNTMEKESPALSYLQANYIYCQRHSSPCRRNFKLHFHISSGIAKPLLQDSTEVRNKRCFDCSTDLPLCLLRKFKHIPLRSYRLRLQY